MRDHILFITGKLAENSLRRVLGSLERTDFDWTIEIPGVAVAALITGDMLERRLGDLGAFTRVVLPGRCRGDLERLTRVFGVPFERGPEELKDLPAYFGTGAARRDIGPTDVKIFAEIVDAPQLDVDATLARAHRYLADGADVIDIGCLPDTPFPHLEDTVRALRADGIAVSVDSLDADELRRGIAAGADYCFSLTSATLDLVDDSDCIPVLIGDDPRDLDQLCRLVDRCGERGRPFYADAVIDPIHYGFTASLERYAALRRRYPDIDIMLGIGNLSELTHTDSLGLNTLLMGVVSELRVTGVLTTEVSPHCHTAVRELDRIRRVMYAAREDNTPPRHLDESLMALHDRHPFPYSDAEIAEFAADVRDPNFRIQVSASGIHVYNRDGLRLDGDPYELFPQLGVDDDAPHAFYLGMELARARIAWQLGKRYEQDEDLAWGCVLPRKDDDHLEFAAARSTLQARRARRKPD